MSAHQGLVTVVITCALKPNQIEAARHELANVIPKVMAVEPACHGVRVHSDPADPRRLLIVEWWDSEQIFLGPHMQTPHMQAFLAKAQEFLDGPAVFTFWKEILKA